MTLNLDRQSHEEVIKMPGLLPGGPPRQRRLSEGDYIGAGSIEETAAADLVTRLY